MHPSRANPVLAGAKFTWSAIRATNPFQQLAVNFANQPQAQGKGLQTFQTVIHGTHVVDNFLDILREFPALGVDLKLEDILKGALCALDLGAQHRLLAHVHRNEEVGIRENGGDAVQSPQCPVCFRQPAQFCVDLDGWIRW